MKKPLKTKFFWQDLVFRQPEKCARARASVSQLFFLLFTSLNAHYERALRSLAYSTGKKDAKASGERNAAAARTLHNRAKYGRPETRMTDGGAAAA